MVDPGLRATLEAAIEAAPDDDRGYEVYADHLQELGDVRGELIALSIAATRDPAADDATRARRKALEAKLAPPGRGAVTWRHGFVERAELPAKNPAAWLAHPSLRFVRELAVSRVANLTPLLAAIASAPAARTIRSLGLGDAETVSDQKVTPDLASLWPAMPNLRRMRLRGIDVRFDGEVPLRELELEASSYYGRRSLESLAAARWPQLSAFSLVFRDNDLDGTRSAGQALVRFLSGSLPALRTLAVSGGILDPRVPAAYAMFELPALLARLESLGLSDNLLDDDNARLIASRLVVCSQLRSLDVSRNRLSHVGIGLLAPFASEFRADGPHRELTREECT